jgi:outer membrane protein assembly factor BamD (BamD/ComL family)
MRYFLILFFLFCVTLSAQQTNLIDWLESSYKSSNLTFNDVNLLIRDDDDDSIRATKNYFRAILNPNIQNAILNHSINFSTFPREFYGQLSGLELVTIDYINNEFDKALHKLERINSELIPDSQYWKAKIAYSMQRYVDAISISQNFISKHPTHSLIASCWLVVLESYFNRNDLNNFEINMQTFSSHREYNDYKPYVLYLQGQLYENRDVERARRLYTQILVEHPNSQFRVSAEDRIYALRAPEVISTPPSITPPTSSTATTVTNKPVSRFEDLDKGRFYLQFGVFSTENAARNYVNTLNRARIPTFYLTKQVGGRRHWAVIQGPFNTINQAQEVQRRYDPKKHQSFIFRGE